MLVIELRHIESEAGLIITEQKLREGLGQFRLAHASRANKEQYAFRCSLLAGMLQSRFSGVCPNQDLIDRMDCLILAFDSDFQCLDSLAKFVPV